MDVITRSHSGIILKVEPTRFVNGLAMSWERKRGARMTPGLGPEQLEGMELPSTHMGEHV